MRQQLHNILVNIGVSRINRIHGYDDLPIHVYQTCRPNARHLKIDSGKGRNDYEAYVSAAVEAIERFTAENLTNQVYMTRKEEIPESLLYASNIVGASPQYIECFAGKNLITNKECLIPRTYVEYNIFSKYLYEHNWPQGTTGLGAHKSYDLAYMSGIIEILERDAIANGIKEEFNLRSNSIIYEYNSKILDKINSYILTKYKSKYDIHVYQIRCNESGMNGGFNAFGAGFCEEAALMDTYREAMQTWIMRISASRDDWFYSHNSAVSNAQYDLVVTRNSYDELFNCIEHNLPNNANKYCNSYLNQITHKFRSRGEDIFVVDLETNVNTNPICVAKTIIPLACRLKQGSMLTGYPILPI